MEQVLEAQERHAAWWCLSLNREKDHIDTSTVSAELGDQEYHKYNPLLVRESRGNAKKSNCALFFSHTLS